ncbi:Cap15 family cyclic dinucleotide receptor domain-containing protein [Caballeronia grimmiae]|uniref:Cap15 family cyclic dinucleotide receptor domain-containing protein n=1 Tax=Caballeronia grimmiae TaxID=1071679 RepID=UPI0038BD6B83
MTDHEYSILDHDRGRIFQYIGMGITAAAALYAAGVGLTGQLLTKWFPAIWSFIPKTLDTTLAFAVLYFLFNKFFWRLSICRRFFDFHDVSGEWTVTGTTLGPAEALQPEGTPRQWTGTIKIKQQWTKIGVHLCTQTSESFSRSASVQDVDGQALLMYSYSNDPSARARAADGLQVHRGYCELKFNADGRSATGFYFNNMGRVTHGEMHLTKAG